MSRYPNHAERVGRLVRATLAKTELPANVSPADLARLVGAFDTFQNEMVSNLGTPVPSEFSDLWWELETINAFAQADGRQDLTRTDKEDARRMLGRLRQLVASQVGSVDVS